MRKRVVVLGTTDAGVTAAIEAKRRLPGDVDVTVVRASSLCDTDDPTGLVARTLHDHGVTVMYSAADSVDPESKSVRFCDGRLIHYDDLIDATASDPFVPGPNGSGSRALRPVSAGTRPS